MKDKSLHGKLQQRTEKKLKLEEESLEKKKLILTVAVCYSVALVIVRTGFPSVFLRKMFDKHSCYFFFITCTALTLAILNSLFDPIIYSVRIREFRKTFISELICRRYPAQVEEIERSVIGPRKTIAPTNETRRDEGDDRSLQEMEHSTNTS